MYPGRYKQHLKLSQPSDCYFNHFIFYSAANKQQIIYKAVSVCNTVTATDRSQGSYMWYIYNYTKKSRDLTITSYCNVCSFRICTSLEQLFCTGAQNRSWRIRAVRSIRSSPPVKRGTTAVAPLLKGHILRSSEMFPIAVWVPQTLTKSRTLVQHSYVFKRALVALLRRTSLQQLQILVVQAPLVSRSWSKHLLNWDRLVNFRESQGCLSSKS